MHSDFPKMELELECIPILQKGIGFGIDQLQFRKKRAKCYMEKTKKLSHEAYLATLSMKLLFLKTVGC